MRKFLITVVAVTFLSAVFSPSQVNALSEYDRFYGFVIGIAQEEFDRSRWDHSIQPQWVDQMEKAHNSCVAYAKAVH